MRIYLINHIVNGVKHNTDIEAISINDAEDKANEIGLCIDYDHICPIGRLIKTIPTKSDGLTPDWNNSINHEITEQN